LKLQLKTDFPDLELPLPRKRWFGDNFNPSFIHDRTMGLQQFIDFMFKKEQLQLCMALREFFCLDEPPTAADGMDESRVSLIYLFYPQRQKESLKWLLDLKYKFVFLFSFFSNTFQSVLLFQGLVFVNKNKKLE